MASPLSSAEEADPSLVSTMEQVSLFLKRLADDRTLESHLRSKLRKNWQSFSIPAEDKITSLAKLPDGFVAGLESGNALIVVPPAVYKVELHQGPVVGLFAVNSAFLVVASRSCLQIWNGENEANVQIIQCAVPVTCVTGSIAKELFFLGSANGVINPYLVKDRENCEVQIRPPFQCAQEVSGVVDMKTNDSTTWMAARYVSNAVILWDHVNDTMLYHFTFMAGPGLPSVWVLGETTNLPKHFEPAEGWDVFPECVILSSALIFRMSGSTVSKLYSTKRPVEADDLRWKAYSDSLQKGHVSSWCAKTLISFTKSDEHKKQSWEKVAEEVEISLGLDFSIAERSEGNNYLAFACPSSLEVLCMSAVEADFIHRMSGPAHLSKDQGYLYTRFHRLLNQQGETLLKLESHERVVSFSPNSQWVTCTSEKHESRSVATFSIKNLHRTAPEVPENSPKRLDMDRGSKMSTILTLESVRKSPPSIRLSEIWPNGQLLHKEFSKDSKFFALLFNKGLIVYRLEDEEVVFKLDRGFTEECRLKYDWTGRLLLTGRKRLSILYPGSKSLIEIPWEYSRISFLNHSATEAIAYSLSGTCHCTLDRVDSTLQLTPLAEMQEGFEAVETLNNHQHCVGENDSGVILFLAKDLTKLVHFKPGYEVMVSKTFPTLFTFCKDVKSSGYGMMDVWDLNLGLNVQSFPSGLKHLLNNKRVVKISGTFGSDQSKNISKLVKSRARIMDTWIIDLDRFIVVGDDKGGNESVSLSVSEEQFERQCIIWKQLSTLVNLNELHPDLAPTLIQPFNLNILHLLAHKSQSLLLEQAMDAGASFIRSTWGSPLTLCLEHKSRKSVDTILFGLIRLRENSLTKFASAVFHMNDDLLDLLSFGSRYLADFLKLVMVPLPEDVLAKTVIKPFASLPNVQLSDNVWIDYKMYGEDRTNEDEKVTVEYHICPLDVYIDMGSTNSLKVLQVLTSLDDMDVLTAPFVQQIIDLKWQKLWWVISVHTLLYWCLLIAMVCRMFDYGSYNGITVVYVFLNSLFVLFEIVKFASAPGVYYRHYWNYLCLIRAIFTYTWIFTDYYSDLTFVVVLLSMFRGIPTFEAFDKTRFYSRMIFDVILNTSHFVWIFFYFTFGFGLLYEAACFRSASNPMNSTTTSYYFWNAWTTSMELDMGNFNVDGYGLLYWLVFMFGSFIDVFIMLNLVVSVLGDAFSNFQAKSDALDTLKKAELLCEYEPIIGWRRLPGVKKRIQICKEEGGGAAEDDWGGKTGEIRKMVEDMEKTILHKMKKEIKKTFEEMEKESRSNAKFGKISEACVHLKSEVGRLSNLVESHLLT